MKITKPVREKARVFVILCNLTKAAFQQDVSDKIFLLKNPQ